MKKTYITPSTHTVKIAMQSIVCGSITQSGDNLNVTIGGDEGSFDDNTINSRQGGWFDDEE